MGFGRPAFAAKPVPPSAPPAHLQPDYFFTIDLDPRYQIIGKGALTPEVAAEANCYRFLYNSSGQPRQIDYLRAGMPTPDPLFGVAQIDFDYQPGMEHRWYRDALGGATANLEGIQGEELTLNAAGYPTVVTNVDASGAHMRDSSGVIQYARTLDGANRLVSGRRIGWLGTAITDDSGYFETRTLYDNQGRRIEYANYDSSGNLLNNTDGTALDRITYTIYPDSVLTVRSYFDTSGQPVPEKSTGVHEFQRVTDNRGFPVSIAYFDETGAPSVDLDGGTHERRYTYDERGNRLSEEFFDTDGKPKDQKTLGFAKVFYKYDDKNRVIEKAYFGDDGTPQVVPDIGAAVVRQEYDANGFVTRLQFFDGKGHPSSSVVYGAPSIRIETDGKTTFIRLRDQDDRPTKNPRGGYYLYSYKTAKGDHPLTNHYYDWRGRTLSFFPRVSVINPHLYALSTNALMRRSARYGALATGVGALIACFIAMRKSSHTRRRKVYVPRQWERVLGWFAILAIIEGTIRFFLTVYWWWINHENGRMGSTIYFIEAVIVSFFIYRLFRLRNTLRVLNIEKTDIHSLIHDFFARTNLKPEWVEARRTYLTPPLDVRVNFFQQKYHAYLAFKGRHQEGHALSRALVQFIRAKAGGLHAPLRSRTIKFYYRSVALCYFLLAGTAFYTFWQLVKKY